MKSIIYHFDPVLYPFPLLVSKDFEIEELRKIFYIMTSETEAEEIGNGFDRSPTNVAKTARVINKDTMNVYYLVLLYKTKDLTPGLIAHEAFHANTYNCDLLGIPGISAETDEPQAYFVQWATDCIDSVLKDHPDKMKGTKWHD